MGFFSSITSSTVDSLRAIGHGAMTPFRVTKEAFMNEFNKEAAERLRMKEQRMIERRAGLYEARITNPFEKYVDKTSSSLISQIQKAIKINQIKKMNPAYAESVGLHYPLLNNTQLNAMKFALKNGIALSMDNIIGKNPEEIAREMAKIKVYSYRSFEEEEKMEEANEVFDVLEDFEKFSTPVESIEEEIDEMTENIDPKADLASKVIAHVVLQDGLISPDITDNINFCIEHDLSVDDCLVLNSITNIKQTEQLREDFASGIIDKECLEDFASLIQQHSKKYHDLTLDNTTLTKEQIHELANPNLTLPEMRNMKKTYQEKNLTDKYPEFRESDLSLNQMLVVADCMQHYDLTKTQLDGILNKKNSVTQMKDMIEKIGKSKNLQNDIDKTKEILNKEKDKQEKQVEKEEALER